MVGRKSFDVDNQRSDIALQSVWAKERELFLRLGISDELIKQLILKASMSASTLEDVLLADLRVPEDLYFAALAEELNLPFEVLIEPTLIRDFSNIDLQLRTPTTLVCFPPDAMPYAAIVPCAHRIEEQKLRISENENVARRLVVTTRSAVRQTVWVAGAERRLYAATSQLFESDQNCSARIALKGRQGFVAGCLVVGLAAWSIAYTAYAVLSLHFLLSGLFLLGLVFRGLAFKLGRPPYQDCRAISGHSDWPIYTVLVALHQESEMVSQLVKRLSCLDWPATKLDIKLVCEANDHETLRALEHLELGPQFEIVRVPEGSPKTKPKALNYALAGARGEFTVIYDAETGLIQTS